jgi:hypothetical protein
MHFIGQQIQVERNEPPQFREHGFEIGVAGVEALVEDLLHGRIAHIGQRLRGGKWLKHKRIEIDEGAFQTVSPGDDVQTDGAGNKPADLLLALLECSQFVGEVICLRRVIFRQSKEEKGNLVDDHGDLLA